MNSHRHTFGGKTVLYLSLAIHGIRVERKDCSTLYNPTIQSVYRRRNYTTYSGGKGLAQSLMLASKRMTRYSPGMKLCKDIPIKKLSTD